MARLDIVGSKDILMVDLEGMCMRRYRRPKLKPLSIGLSLLSESTQMVSSLLANGIRFATGTLKSTHDVLVERFVDSISNGSESPVTAEEGREAVRVTNMIVDKLREKFGAASSVLGESSFE
jgi:hypothetical protein